MTATECQTINVHKMVKEIENRFRVDLYDLNRSLTHYDRWHKKKGYPATGPNGKHKNASQVWYKHYESDPQGGMIRPAYFNFWHWLLDQTGFLDWIEEHPDEPKYFMINEEAIPDQEYTDEQREQYRADYMSYLSHFTLTDEQSRSAKKQLEETIKNKAAKGPGAKKVICMILKHYGGPIRLEITRP